MIMTRERGPYPHVEVVKTYRKRKHFIIRYLNFVISLHFSINNSF